MTTLRGCSNSPRDGVAMRAETFVLYREPLARLVSAFYYCKHSRWLYDPLCASAELDARNATFASIPFDTLDVTVKVLSRFVDDAFRLDLWKQRPLAGSKATRLM